MITNYNPGHDYFRALIDFERDSLAPTTLPENASVLSGVPYRSPLLIGGMGSAQPLEFQSPSGGGCAGEFTLSQLEPLETV